MRELSFLYLSGMKERVKFSKSFW